MEVHEQSNRPEMSRSRLRFSSGHQYRIYQHIVSLTSFFILILITLPIHELIAQRSSAPSAIVRGSRRHPNPRTYEDIRPPSIELNSPGECTIIENNDPLIVIRYRDLFSGVDLSTLVIRIDDVDYTSSFTVGPDEATYQVPSSPGLTEGEHEIEVSISDTRGNTQTEVYLFGVDTVSGGEPLELGCSGFIDGVVYDAATDQPLLGAKVRVTGIDGEVETDSNGRYVFPVPYSGEWGVTIEYVDYTLVQRKVKSVMTRDVAPYAAFLTPFDVVKTKIKSSGGTHINSTGEIKVYFPPGAVSDSIEVQSTKYKKGKHLPGKLPDTSIFTYALDLQPDNTTFDGFVTVSVKNALGFAPGTLIPVGVWNDSTLQWDDTGIMAEVSADGEWVEYQVDHFTPYDVNFPPPPALSRFVDFSASSDNTPEVKDPDKVCAKDIGNSMVILKTGELVMDHELPSVRSLNTASGLRFVYNSISAYPSALISFDTDLDTSLTEIPSTTTFRATVEGVTDEATYDGVEGEVRYAYLFEGRNGRGEWLGTGSYPFEIEISNDYDSLTYWTADNFGGIPILDTGVLTDEPVSFTRTINGRIFLNNLRNSPFGAGWSLAGLQRLHFDPDGSMLLTDGDGTILTLQLRERNPIVDLAVTNAMSNNVSILPGLGDGTFRDEVRYGTGILPETVAAGDFNGDDIEDLVVVNGSSDDLSILIGIGDGSFADETRLEVGDLPKQVAVGNFNGDNMDDLAISDNDNAVVLILLGNGGGPFVVGDTCGVGDNPSSIVVGDFDDDGNEDLAVTNQDSDDLSILLGRGDGSFADDVRYNVGTGPSSIAIGYFNGDTVEDLAFAVQGYWTSDDDSISILLGVGDGTFLPGNSTVIGDTPVSIATGDFNGDGHGDMAVARNYPNHNVVVMLGLGDGSFSEGETIDVGGNPEIVIARDFGDDDIEDLVVVNDESDEVLVMLGRGDGTFRAADRYSVGYLPTSVAIGDFDDDGIEDISVVNRGSFAVSILFGLGNGRFSGLNRFNTGEGPGSVTVGDFNDDDLVDLAIVTAEGGNIAILLGLGNGTFRLDGTYGTAPGPTSVTVSDFNNDDIEDLAVTCRYSSFWGTFDSLSILLGSGDGVFDTGESYDFGESLPISITHGDFDNDGNEDLAVANNWTNDMSILLGRGDGTFADEVRYDAGFGPEDIVAGDFNKDGNLDLAVPNILSYEVSVFLGNGDGTFADDVLYVAGSGPLSIAIGDFDNNGNDDLAVANHTGHDVSILLGNGDGTFASDLRFDVGDQPFAIAVGDFDGDGNDDLAVTNKLNDDLSILMGIGNGTFEKEVRYGAFDYPFSIVVGDFNGDYYEEGYGVSSGDYSFVRVNPDESFTRVLKNGTEIHFDEDGYHLSTVDRNGNTTQYGYYGDGRLETVTDPAGRVYHFDYDGTGHLESVTDPAGRVTRFTVDERGDLVEIMNPDSSTTGFGYDERHLLDKKISARNDTTNYSYDDHGRIEQVHAPTDETRHYFPGDVFGLINDLPDTVGTPENPTTVVRPDSVQDILVDGKGNPWTYRTDMYGARRSFTDPMGLTTSYERDRDSNLSRLVRPNGSEVELTYDGTGNIITYEEKFNNAVTAFTYESDYNQVTSIRDPLFNFTWIDYDSSGNPVEVINAEADTTHMEYDSRGLLTRVTDPLGNVTRSVYNPVTGNIDSIINPLNHVLTFTYDDAGNIETVVDPVENITTYIYDPMNRPIQIIDAESETTFFNYDASGNLSRVIDAKGDTTTFDYDELDLISRIINSLGDSSLYAYDLNRNVDSITDNNGRTISFKYNEANQLTRKFLPDGLVVYFTYDTSGKIDSASDNDSELEFVYDDIGRLIEAKTLSGGVQPVTVISYTYDKNGNRLTMTDPENSVTNYEYDDLNRLTRINNPSYQSTDFEYDDNGRRTLLGSGNNTSSTYDYDAAGNLVYLTLDPLGLSYAYHFNAAGVCTTLVETIGDHVYSYDPIYRLIHATHPDSPDESYSYDPVGNRTSQGGIFDDANRLLEDDNFIITYDRNGNLIEMVEKVSSDTTRYTYDVENQLIRIDFADGGYAAYRYDALGRRIEKSVDGAVTRYIHDNEDILFEYDGSSQVVARYTHGPGIDEPVSMDRGGQSYFFHADRLGSIRALTDLSGVIQGTYRYGAFGDIVEATVPFANPYTYTGRELDVESGLYYYRARYYAPEMGRFLSEDPIGILPFGPRSGLFHPYVYVWNNPVNFIDPTGLEGFWVELTWSPYHVCYYVGTEGIYKGTGFGVGLGAGLLFAPTGPNEGYYWDMGGGYGGLGGSLSFDECGECSWAFGLMTPGASEAYYRVTKIGEYEGLWPFLQGLYDQLFGPP